MTPIWLRTWLTRWRAWRASRFATDLVRDLKLTRERRQMFIRQERSR
jgi:hypothetical protein